jgi:hypothetical protein
MSRTVYRHQDWGDLGWAENGVCGEVDCGGQNARIGLPNKREYQPQRTLSPNRDRHRLIAGITANRDLDRDSIRCNDCGNANIHLCQARQPETRARIDDLGGRTSHLHCDRQCQ